MKEKYILIEDVEELGRAGDVVAVTDGYARNYLLPKKLALRTSKGALRQFEARKEKIEAKRQEGIAKCKAQAANIESLVVNIPMNVGEDNKLYGSVTNHMIAEAIEKHGIKIDQHKISIQTPIKELGTYEVKIKLHSEVSALAKINVVKA
jgi:large subunit ribosomal protein L9